jgi:hypothetical protein
MKGILSAGAAGAALVLGAVMGASSAGAVPVGVLQTPHTDSAVIDVRRGGRGGGFHGGGYRGGGYRGGYRGFGGYGYRGRGFHRGYRGGRAWRYRGYGDPGFVFYGAPFLYYYYDEPYYYDGPYNYGGPCLWLRRRAVRTGSGYWWRRYRRCVRYYY